MSAMAERENWLMQFTDALTGGVPLVKSKGAKPWYRSSSQQMKIFYEILKVPLVRNRKTGRPTADDNALTVIGKREPLLLPICKVLAEYRSLGVFLSTFVQCPLDWDNRMRSSFGVGMTETLRNTSSEDAFGFGGNMQNVSKGTEK
jgi:DNA polymerase I-like protein with 3'-5' exonuclease and polymerase domains